MGKKTSNRAQKKNGHVNEHGFVMMNRSDMVDELVARNKNAAALLMVIAKRAWRGPLRNRHNCRAGEAFIGDYAAWSGLQGVISGFANYPVYDEELMSQMEEEAKWEDWQEYGRSSTREALIKKFNGDADAQIAVLAKRNEFWDTIYREHDFYQNTEIEDGGTVYLNAKNAVEDIERDKIVNEAEVEAAKKETFTKDYEQKLWQALEAAGITVADADHVWETVKYAESGLGPNGVWDVSGRITSTRDEIDPKDYLELRVEDIVKALSEPEAHQKMMRRPRRQKAFAVLPPELPGCPWPEWRSSAF